LDTGFGARSRTANDEAMAQALEMLNADEEENEDEEDGNEDEAAWG